ncbi:MAG: hypothetical protein ACKVT1_20120 [Dehalococcoidia bacterium]
MPLEERLSDTSGEFYLGLPSEKRERIGELVSYLRKYPDIDNVRVFRYTPDDTDQREWRVLVESDYTLYFRVDGSQALIDLITETSPDVRQAALA